MIAGVPSHRRKQRLPPRFAGTPSLVLLGTATAMAAPSEQLVGRWYSEGVENGTYLQLVDDRRTDGTFTLVLRTRLSCETARSWQEAGSWDYATGTLTKWTRTVGNRAVPDSDDFHDRFSVTPTDDDHVKLLDAKTEISWSLMRVPSEFSFPAPPHCKNS
jgi:hypothetical protein